MAETPGLTAFYKALSAKGKEAMWRKKAQGETMHLAPIGFKNCRIAGRATITPDPVAILAIELTRHLRSQCYSLRQIAWILTELGMSSKRGNPFGPMAIGRMLASNFRKIQRVAD